ncbi:uncharacterized protein [Dendropsophus ebraccatus]|uniref:uncharacterized protein n=1 Tax=Dendropsophus ebraccatus TaxID=150705 RepID=UPI0038312D6D
MASAILREELLCSICLSVFKDPVMLRCGHNFCRLCIDLVLDTQDGSGVYSCPECREEYQQRPALMRNINLHNVAERFLVTQPDQEEITGICCTYCVDSAVPAVISCLLCEASLCDKHLRAHSKSPEHVLSEPSTSLEKRKCSVHKKMLEYYCTEDAICICVSCRLDGEHQGHRVEMLDEASEKKRRNVLQKLMTKREETEERVQSVEERRRKAQEKAAGEDERVTALFTDIRRRLDDLEKRVLSEISRQEKEELLSLSALIQQLEIKKDELSRKMRHIEELCNMADPLTVLQEPDTGDLCDPEEGGGDEDTGRRDRQLHDVDDLDVTVISDTFRTLCDIISGIRIYGEGPADILLDVNTAHNNLLISDDLKTVTWTLEKQNRPERAERFQNYPQVMSGRRFSLGRHYWDVESSRSVRWIVGMCYPSIDRRGRQSVIGDNNKSWCLERGNNQYSVIHDSKGFQLPDNISSNRVRICLDYEAGQLSFYELCDPIRHLHTFTATFTEPLHAALWVWGGSIKIVGGGSSIRSQLSLRGEELEESMLQYFNVLSIQSWSAKLQEVKLMGVATTLVIQLRHILFNLFLPLSAMASAILRDELLCSICLSVFKDPVMLRCGHNFCRVCIGRVLDTQDGAGVYSCPECREEYQERPALMRNINLHNVAERFLVTQPEQAEITGICCTYCVDSAVPAVISCLHCEASLCDKHLRAHSKSPEHVLSEPSTSLEKRKCSVHKKVLEYYCTEDSACICVSCSLAGEHWGHQVEMLDEASEKKKKKLRNVLQKLMTKREETEERVQSVEELRRKAQEKAAGEAERVTVLFTDIRRRLDDLEKRVLSEISRQEKEESLSLSALIQQLEIKKDELSRKMKHIEELCNMADPLTVLQGPDTGDLCDPEEGGGDEDTGGHDRQPHDVDDLDVTVISDTFRTLCDIISGIRIYGEGPADILLDVNTAHNNLLISDDLKTATWTLEKQNRPETAERFQDYSQVMSSRRFSSGRHYWDVEISRSVYWRVGMCYPSIDRRGRQSVTGNHNKSWIIGRYNNQYSVIHDREVIWLPDNISSNRVRIYLDYEAGQLSFYELCDPIRHLHTCTATFTEPLYAILWARGGSIKVLGEAAASARKSCHTLQHDQKAVTSQRAPSS